MLQNPDESSWLSGILVFGGSMVGVLCICLLVSQCIKVYVNHTVRIDFNVA